MLDRSNSLTDLAARIRAEHEAASSSLKHGMQHAIAAGTLLSEAKAKMQHGGWLAWLEANCAISQRTVQAYMRVARSFATLDDDTKAQRVADLSFRDALNSLAATAAITKGLPPESYGRALERVEQDQSVTLRRAINHVRAEEVRSRFSLETPQAMLPSPTGRKTRVARNAAKRQWLLAIGPNTSRAALIEKEKAAREMPAVRKIQKSRDDLLRRAAALEAEAKMLREKADSFKTEAAKKVAEIIGPALPFTETYDFQCDLATDAELAALSQDQLVERLVAARGTASKGLAETERGYWGDLTLPSSQDIGPGPGAWTKMGSPEWLEDVFPGWNKTA